MALVPITWSGEDSVSGASAVNSDAVSTAGASGFSASVQIAGTGAGGISGNVFLLVGNVNPPTTMLPGSLQPVLLADGASQTFIWSSSTYYAFVELGWVPGSATNGELSDGEWSIVTIAPSPPTPIPAPTKLPANTSALQAQSLAQYGIDVLCLTDLDPNFSLTNALPQDLYHLVSEAPGSIFWSAVQTFSILNLLSMGFTPAAQSLIQATLQAVILGDERVAQCQVSVSFDGEETLAAFISVVPQQTTQQFQLVCSITKVSISLISAALIGG
jgi:hypothetical protein